MPASVNRQVLGLAYPVVLSTLASTLMGLTDTLFMGWVSTAAQGGVGVGAILAWSSVSVFVGTLGVLNTFVAQHFGAGEENRCGPLLWHGVALALGFSLLTVLLAPQVRRLVALFGADPEVGAIAARYALIRLAGAPAQLLEAALTAFLRGLGDTRTPMKVSFLEVALNVPLNFWLIFGGLGVPALGPDGAAYATVASQAVGVAILSWFVLRPELRARYATFLPRRLDRGLLVSLLKVGLPIGVGWQLEMVTWTVFAAFVSGFGKQALAAHNIVIQVLHVSFMPGMGLSVAATTLVGQHLGAREQERAAQSGYAALKLGMAYMGVMGLIFLCFGATIAAGFNRDPEVIGIARRLFMMAAAFQMFDAMGMVSAGILRGAGDTRWPMLAAIFYAWVVFVPLIWLLGKQLGWGVMGSWGGATIYIVGLGVTLLGRVLSGRWRSYTVLEAGATSPPARGT